MGNRRVAHRFPLELPVQIRVTAAGSSERVPGKTRDISRTGLYFFSAQRLHAGSDVEVVLTLPPKILPRGEAQVRCRCRVVRVEASANGKPASGAAATIDDYDFLSSPR